MQIGTILTAINPCIMEESNKAALTVGKEYPVIKFHRLDGQFAIIDDFNDVHWFAFNGKHHYSQFFKLVNNYQIY
jgi:hypothetical protein